MPKLERTLILETSGNVGRVGIASGKTVLAEDSLSRERRRASDLAALCQRLLKEQGWDASDLTSVIVGLGPGSYTALRVGVASAKMLAYATGAAFVGVETFAAYAYQCDSNDITVIADALQGEVYFRRYLRDENGLRPITELEIRKLSEVQATLGNGADIIGPGLKLLNTSDNASNEDLNLLRLESMIGIADDHEWAVSRDMWTAEPFYLRGSSAEEKKRKEALSS